MDRRPGQAQRRGGA
ncbi:2-oxoacid dehydrogenase acyltransferase, catalytic domain protein, partial [Bordetella hinzii L60]